MQASNPASFFVRLPCAGLMDVQHHVQLQSQVPRVMSPRSTENLTGTVHDEMTTRKTRPAMQTRKLDCAYVFLVSISHTEKLTNFMLCWLSECLQLSPSRASRFNSSNTLCPQGQWAVRKQKTKHRDNLYPKENDKRTHPRIHRGTVQSSDTEIWISFYDKYGIQSVRCLPYREFIFSPYLTTESWERGDFSSPSLRRQERKM